MTTEDPAKEVPYDNGLDSDDNAEPEEIFIGR